MKLARIILPIILLLTIVTSVMLGATLACADEAKSVTTYGYLDTLPNGYIDLDAVYGNRYSVSDSVTNSGEHIGITFSGGYFVTVEPKLPYTIIVYDSTLYRSSSRAINLTKQLHAVANYVDSIANTQYVNSDVYNYNNLTSGQSVAISDTTASMITIAKDMYKLTNGAFNPAIYRLVDLWGFSSRTYYKDGSLPYDRQWQMGVNDGDYYPLPEEKYIEAFTTLSNFDNVILEGTKGNYSLKKNSADVVVDGISYSQWIDLGGIAKGYVVELAKEILAQYDCSNYIMNLASSSIALSSDSNGEGTVFKLGSPDKTSAKPYASIYVENSTMSTSGVYERMYMCNGKAYSHIIDGRTGYPTDGGVQTVTTVGDNAVIGDCLTTALSLMDIDEVATFASDNLLNNGTDMYGVYSQGKNQYLMTTKALETLRQYDPQYKVILAPTTDSNGNTVLEILDTNSSNWVVILAVLVVVFMLAVTLYSRFHYPKGAMSDVDSVRKDRLFKLKDVIVYGVILVVMAGLFVGLVFTSSDKPYTSVEIATIDFNKILLLYDRDSHSCQVFNDDKYQLVVSEEGDNITIYIYDNDNGGLSDGKDNYINVVTISASGSVKMTDSHCGHHQECVKVFPAIKHANDVIVCSPNNIKVVGKGR